MELERRGAVGILTVNRPEALNALNAEVLKALDEQITAAAADDEILVLVLTGAGRSFVAGANRRMSGLNAIEGKNWGATGNQIFRKLENPRNR